VNSSNLGIDGSKLLGIALSSNNIIKKVEISWNEIRNGGAVLLTRGIMVAKFVIFHQINLTFLLTYLFLDE